MAQTFSLLDLIRNMETEIDTTRHNASTMTPDPSLAGSYHSGEHT